MPTLPPANTRIIYLDNDLNVTLSVVRGSPSSTILIKLSTGERVQDFNGRAPDNTVINLYADGSVQTYSTEKEDGSYLELNFRAPTSADQKSYGQDGYVRGPLESSSAYLRPPGTPPGTPGYFETKVYDGGKVTSWNITQVGANDFSFNGSVDTNGVATATLHTPLAANVLTASGPGTLNGAASISAQQLFITKGGLLIGQDGGSLIGPDGGSIISRDGAGIISRDGAGLIGNDGSTLIGNDGSTLVAAGGGNLVAAGGLNNSGRLFAAASTASVDPDARPAIELALNLMSDLMGRGAYSASSFAPTEGGSVDDVVLGGEYDDVLRGGLGADAIDGGAGNDTLYGADSDFIRNGSFETVFNPQFDANGYGYNEPIDGWTVLSGSHLELFKSSSAAGAPADGKYGVDLEGDQANSNVTISQVVQGLIDGEDYRLAFDASKVNANAMARMEVYFGGEKLTWTINGVTTDYIDPTVEGLVYYIDLTGGAGTGADRNRLTFKEVGAGDAHGALLDKIRMYRVEPGAPKAGDNDPYADGGDTFVAGTGSDIVYGHGGDDVVAFNDIGPGVDQFDGGSGVDLLIMDWSGSTTQIIYNNLSSSGVPNLAPRIGQAESYSRAGAGFNEPGQELFFKNAERFILKGGTGNDTLKGGELDDILVGNGGDDTLNGGGGVDELDGGEGFDRAVIQLSGSGANTVVLKNVMNGGTVTLSNGTKLTSIEAIDLISGDGDDFLDVRGTVINPAGMASTDLAFKSVSTRFEGKGGNDTLAVDLATSDHAFFDGGAGAGDLLIMDWSAATQSVARFSDGAYRSYQKTINVTTGGQTFTTEYHYTASFTGVERFDLLGGLGDDTLFGGSGDDVLRTIAGRDVLTAGAGFDTLVVDWSKIDRSVSFRNADNVGGAGLTGTFATGYSGDFAGDDSRYYNRVDFSGIERFEIKTGKGNDSVWTGDGDDIVSTSEGGDHLITGKGVDIVDGGLGNDRWEADKSFATAAQAISVNLQTSGVQSTYLTTGTVRGVEMLTLKTGAAADTIVTAATDLSNTSTHGFDDVIDTGAGADRVMVTGGRDVVAMGANSDILIVDWSQINRSVSFRNADNVGGVGLSGTFATGYSGDFAGDDSRYYNRVAFSGVERFDIRTGNGNDGVWTGDGNDSVSTAGGNDHLITGKGIDVVDGGLGDDRWEADKSFATSAQAINVNLQLTGVQSTHLTAGTVRGIEMLTLKTGAAADTIVTAATVTTNTQYHGHDDVIDTGAGNDRVTVTGGRDVVTMGAASDTLVVDWSQINRSVSFRNADNVGGVGLSGAFATGYAGDFAGDDSRYYNRVAFSGVERFEIKTGNGNDGVWTGDGDDSVSTAGGNDHLITGKGIDVVDGGEGDDRWEADKSFATAGQSVNVNLQTTGVQSTYLTTGTVRGVEMLTLKTGAGDDTIVTAATVLSNTSTHGHDDALDTGAGSDRVTVTGGRDVVAMGDGVDTLVVDWSQIDRSVSFRNAAGGDSTLTYDATGYSGDFAGGDSRYYNRVAFSGVDVFDVRTGNGNDSIGTGNGDDKVSTGGGDDHVNSGTGVDVIDGGAGVDRWTADKSFASAAQAISVNLQTTGVQSTYLTTGTVRGVEMLTLKTGNGADTIVTAGTVATITSTFGYDDVIDTGAGSDRVTVTGGRDVVAMGDGVDTLVVDWSQINRSVSFRNAEGVDSGLTNGATGYSGDFAGDDARYYNRVAFSGVDAFDVRTGGGNDRVGTGNGDDRVSSGAGDDYVNSGTGVDVIDGGLGADRWEADKSFATATQAISVNLQLTGVQSTYLSTGVVRGVEMLTLKTGAAADTIVTAATVLSNTSTHGHDDVVDTGAGNDRVTVTGGRDTVVMGTGVDTLVVDWSQINRGVSLRNADNVGGVGVSGSLATGYSGDFAGDDSRYYNRVAFSGVEHFDLRLGGGADNVTTGDGNDTLNGGGGADVLRGMGGNDAYFVDNADDQVFEAAGGGADVVRTSVHYRLAAGQEIEVLTTTLDTGTAGVDLTGNEFAQLLRGNAGANMLNGGAGADQLYGLGGDDTYIVDNIGDRVYEVAGGGSDTVKTTLSYMLAAGQEIEVLSTTLDTGVGAIGLTGNEFAQTLRGNAGANLLRGGGGADVLDGLGGIDTADYTDKTQSVSVTLNGATAATVLVGGIAEDTILNIENLIGGAAADSLTGDGLGNVLNGGGGADVLRGMGGSDVYFVDNGNDQAFEEVGGGADVVRTSVHYKLAAGQEIEVITTTLDAGTAGVNLTGNEFAQLLRGNAGANSLNGGAGADQLYGLGGNDTYIVDNVGDRVYEAVGGGSDTVKAAIGYTLAAGQEIEVLATILDTGTANIKLTGNEFGQTLRGNAGANTLDGKAGADQLYGLGGNDAYFVDDAGDRVYEAVGGGSDTVRASVSHALAAGQEIEALTTTLDAGTDSINLTGNQFAQLLRGNAGMNTLNGGAGADQLYGLGGDDAYLVDDAGDRVFEAVNGGFDTVRTSVSYTLSSGQEIESLVAALETGTGAINFTGNEFGQTIRGNSGANIITGGGGRDVMTGGFGRDVFDFNAVSDSGATAETRDVVTDFVKGVDKIDLSTIDANGPAAGHDFIFLPTAGAAFTGVAGQLIFVLEDNAGTAGDRTIISADTNGDSIANFQIELAGLINLTASDIVL